MSAIKYNIEDLDQTLEHCLYVFKIAEYVLKLVVNSEGYCIKIYRDEMEIRKSKPYLHSDSLAQFKAIHEVERAVKLLMELKDVNNN